MPGPYLISPNAINRLQRIDRLARRGSFYGTRKNCSNPAHFPTGLTYLPGIFPAAVGVGR